MGMSVWRLGWGGWTIFTKTRVLTRAPRFPSTSKSSNPRDTWFELRLHVQHTNPVFYIILFYLNIYPWLQCITRVSISNFYFYLFTVKLRQSWNPTWWAPPLRQPYIGSGHRLPNLLRLLFFQCFPWSWPNYESGNPRCGRPPSIDGFVFKFGPCTWLYYMKFMIRLF